MLPNLKGLFTPQAIAAVFTQLPPIKTTIIDKVYPKSINHPLPLIGISEVQKVTGTIPVVRRGANPIPLSSGSADASFYAPLPIMPSIDITAEELNDLRVIIGDAASRQSWMANQVDTMRRIVRNTTEAIASVCFTTGKYEWPIRLDGGGNETFSIDFGAPLSYTLTTKLSDTSTVSDVFDLLDDIADKIEEEGFGGNEVKFFAGRKVFSLLVSMSQKWAAAGTANPIDVKLEGGVIDIGGYKIERMSEKYQNPTTKTMTAKIADTDLIGYGSISEAGIYYCAIDSISASNRALPFYVYPEEIGDRVIRLQAQAKPVPIRPSKSICKCTAVA